MNFVAVLIEFLTEHGDLPLLEVDLTGIDNYLSVNEYDTSAEVLNITEVVKGTRQELECSGYGNCNENTGICSCMAGFGSSNGSNAFPGDKGDCSFHDRFYQPIRAV